MKTDNKEDNFYSQPTYVIGDSNMTYIPSVLSKREIYALYAMQGILAGRKSVTYDIKDTSESALRLADLMLEKLK